MNQTTAKKTVLITGGTRGIGKAIAIAFLKKGYAVYATYSKDGESAREAEASGIKTFLADVSDERAVTGVFQAIGRVDILVNNAGVSLIKQLQDTTKEDWERLFAVNVTGTFLCSREAAKGMISQKSGLIVNISSVWGEVGGSCESAYSASKAAILGFTKALSKELGWSGIRVNSISPGVIETRMNAHFSKAELDSLTEEIPLGRLGSPEDVASAVLFLDENDYVTGADIPVNGGFSVV
ncbi:MAG: SDR family oxidoreductase [Clostridia bacterium]|nr:SDR family oxidoreductase [Clostridia bacterium]